MKILHTKILKDGRIHQLIELSKGEDSSLITIPPSSYFRLGYPLEDQIVESHHIKHAQRVIWDVYSQKWVDV
jgi:hypothetical protein